MASVEELCDHIALIDHSKKVLDGNVKEIRKQFKENIFEVRYNTFPGDLATLLPNGFSLLESRTEEDVRIARIRLPREATANDLVMKLIPHISLHGLNEVIPSMNDIFIQTVTGNRPASLS
jgi:ABC-2 type transport system ATP-binding protein